jgi:hypothetical protein
VSRRVHVRVIGRLDMGRPQEGTVTIERDSGLFAVRPLRRRRDYVLPLASVAEMVVARVIKAELAERAAAKRRRRREGDR